MLYHLIASPEQDDFLLIGMLGFMIQTIADPGQNSGSYRYESAGPGDIDQLFACRDETAESRTQRNTYVDGHGR